MKLIYSPTSPFARKVRIVARECGHNGIEEVAEHPLAEGTRVPDFNPLGKVPTLVLDDGDILVDSPLICEFLDQHGRAASLIPGSGMERFRVLQGQALADGAMDAAVSIVMELRRPQAKRSPYWLQRWHDAVMRVLAAIEASAGSMTTRFDMAVISTICLVDYLDFRLAEVVSFRSSHPRLVACWEHHRSRPSLVSTMPRI